MKKYVHVLDISNIVKIAWSESEKHFASERNKTNYIFYDAIYTKF